MNLGTTFNAAVTETNPYWFYNGLKAGKSSQFIADSSGTLTAGAATFNGNVAIPTAANATSTVTVGCVNAYATSSATEIHYTYQATATSSQTGYVLFKYGACP